MAGQGPQQAAPEVQQVLAILASPRASEDEQMRAMATLSELMRGEQSPDSRSPVPGMSAETWRELDRLSNMVAAAPDSAEAKSAYPRITEIMALHMQQGH